MKKTLIAAAALVAMVGCNKTLIESSPAADSNYGYINLGVSADTEMVVTKGVTTEQDGLSLEGYNITIKQAGVALEGWPKEYTEIQNADIKVPAGTYLVEVENFTTDEAHPADEKGFVRVFGSKKISVKAGVSTPCPVACSPVNTKVSFNYNSKFAEVFTTPSVKVGTAVRTLGLTMALDSEELADAAYFEPEELTWTLTAKNANSEEKTFSKKFTPAYGKWTVITFSVGNTDGSIDITITIDGEITAKENISAVLDPFNGIVE